METWGDKPKSQVDNSTVDEEIVALIAVHEADPDSHLEVGESLQSHKASEIIDHIAKSIVEDKLDDGAISSRCITSDQIIGKDFRTASDVGADVDGVSMLPTGIEMWQDGDKKVDIPVSGDPSFKGNVKVGSLEYLKFTLQSFFESLDGWDKTLHINNRLGYCELVHRSSYGDPTTLILSGDAFEFFYVNVSKNLIYDVIISFDPADDCVCYFGMGLLVSESGIGFKITQSNIYAVWFDSDMVEHVSLISAFADNHYHRYRIEFFPADHCDWFIDGVLVKTKTAAELATLNGWHEPFSFYLKSNNDNTVSMYSLGVLFQQNF